MSVSYEVQVKRLMDRCGVDSLSDCIEHVSRYSGMSPHSDNWALLMLYVDKLQREKEGDS